MLYVKYTYTTTMKQSIVLLLLLFHFNSVVFHAVVLLNIAKDKNYSCLLCHCVMERIHFLLYTRQKYSSRSFRKCGTLEADVLMTIFVII